MEFVSDPAEIGAPGAGPHRPEAAPPWACPLTTHSALAAVGMPACCHSKSLRLKNAARLYTEGGSMSTYIATHALRGANALVTEAELMLDGLWLKKDRKPRWLSLTPLIICP